MAKIYMDPRIKKKWGIKPIQRTNAKWSLVSVKLLDPENTAYFIRVAVQDASGAPMLHVLACCSYDGNDGNPCSETEPYEGIKKGKREFDFGASIINPKKGKYGVKYCYVEDRSKSDEVTGLGLVEDTPYNIEVTFKLNPNPPKKQTPSRQPNNAKLKSLTKK